MNNYLVNVKTNKEWDGCYAGSFVTLDEVRAFIKEKAASFRKSNPDVKCEAFVMPNGKKISDGRTFEC